MQSISEHILTNHKSKKNKIIKVLLFLAIIVLFSLISFVANNAIFNVTNEIYQGVFIADIAVGGLSENEADKLIKEAFFTKATNPIRLMHGDNIWHIDAADIDLQFDSASLAKEAYQIGRKGNFLEQLHERYITMNRSLVLPLAVSYNTDKLHQKLVSISKVTDKNPQNATIEEKSHELIIIPEKTGYTLNMAKTLADITAKINTATFGFSITITVDEISPAIVSADLQDINSVISSYTTTFNIGDTNRTDNIHLAAKSLYNILVRKGETLSFNQLVGLRIANQGYKIAPVYLNGQLVPDWGGGVCQVSSTLYNAVLLADMDIVERTSHFRPPGYVPLGQDATVADNQLDLKFRNNIDSNIYIKTEVSGSQLSVTIFGKRKINSPEIKIIATDTKVIEPKVIIKQDAALEMGKQVIDEEGEKGFIVTTYRIKSINGREIQREKLAIDDFAPVDRVVRIGIKSLPLPPKVVK